MNVFIVYKSDRFFDHIYKIMSCFKNESDAQIEIESLQDEDYKHHYGYKLVKLEMGEI